MRRHWSVLLVNQCSVSLFSFAETALSIIPFSYETVQYGLGFKTLSLLLQRCVLFLHLDPGMSTFMRMKVIEYHVH